MDIKMRDNPFDKIDAIGSVNKNEPFIRDIEAEMVRSHALCLRLFVDV